MDLWSERAWGKITQIILMLLSICVDLRAETCHNPLVSGLSPLSFRSSSQLSSGHGPGFAKLNRREGAGGWSPLNLDKYQWLEVDLGGRTQITAVATQGRYGSSDWQTAYHLMFSDTGHNWKQYRWEGRIEDFPGNSNADSVVEHNLDHPVISRFFRLVPLDWNPNGRIGLRLEAYGCPYNSDIVSFDGDSSLFFKLSPRPRQTSSDIIHLAFKTMKDSGILLHAKGQNELSLTLELQKGQLLLLLRKGRSPSPDRLHPVTLGSLLDDQHWHHVAVEQHNSHINLTVDKNTMHVETPPWFTHWNYDQMTVGADENHGSQNSNRNFHGCLENLVYNGQSLIDLAKEKDQQGNVTFSCPEAVFVAMTFIGPHSFLRLPGVTNPHSTEILVGLQFRTWDKGGLLMTVELLRQEGTVWLHLREAKVYLHVHKAGRGSIELKAGSALNDGQWHSVDLKLRRKHLTITVDGNEVASASPTYLITPGGQLFFGGCPTEQTSHKCRNPFRAFQGCMRLLTVKDELVDLIKVQRELMGDYSNLLIDMCDIIDRCSPSHCEHGGRCTQSWSTFHCNCSSTGYSGATCHSSIYEQSCEAYKHKGNTSGYYYIDVDGSGPIKPHLILCNMTEDKTWTVIQHNNTELTKIQPSADRSHHLTHFEYSVDEEQLLAIINQSEYCEQELAYHCRKSRLLNSPEGAPLSWWVGGPSAGQRQTYWGGALPGSQHCACSLQGNCVDPKHHCNCDANRAAWANDTGLLTHKESLPVRSLVLRDVQRPGSESSYKVGPLRCYGDKSIWNAAFFDKETSYLHFPTFHGELSADISLLFKTTSSSGILLENLGIRDFIRLELSSSTEVLFSFDVGNGPLEVSVKAGVPLNDNRWHRIQAERNVREASLRLDELPAATQEAPADGHIHLQLYRGTASRQKGFLGCIRSLQLNGVTLDLEQRAKITPGVQAGCPGHCRTYSSLCQNQGRCVERTKSFSCDCSSSAYNGAFCDKDVSVTFKPETSISYNFKKNPGNELNRSSSSPSSSTMHSMNLRSENVSLSFRTSQSPALFLYVESQHREYLALLLNMQKQLEVRYRLDSSKEEEILRSKVRNLADRQLHSVSISREVDSVTIQVDQHNKEYFILTSGVEFNNIKSLILGRVHNSQELDAELAQLGSLGFTGCLSSVLFNSISPLKAALLHPTTNSVVVRGTLIQSNCGSASANPYAAENTHHQSDQSGSVGGGQSLSNAPRSDSAFIGGLIAVAIFGIVSALAILTQFLYRRQGTCQNQELRKTDDNNGLQFADQTSSRYGPTENHKEYFIYTEPPSVLRCT